MQTKLKNDMGMLPKEDKDSRTAMMAIKFADWLNEQGPTEKIMVSKNFIRGLTTEEMYHKWLRHLEKIKLERLIRKQKQPTVM